MCGICGWFGLTRKLNSDSKIIDRMISSIKHRGPDGNASYSTGNYTAGFCRLSFVDLAGGMQPIFNEDGTICLTCNGEIFNYKELREKLIAKGHVFKTSTDVEVIVHLYEEYGTGFTDYLNGQFAIALYDSKNDSLYLVRDYFGIAPLFYTINDGVLIYGSEIKAILEYPNVERRINLTAVDQVLQFPGIVAPTTFFAGILALRPGHMLVCHKNSEPKDVEYWDIEYTLDDENLGEEYYVEKLRELIIDSIRLRLQADVPVGFYVSGGLDSSVVASFIDHYISHEHCSFSAEVQSEGHNESSYQKILHDRINSQHFRVEINNCDIWECMPEVVYYTESALRESFDVAAYLLSKLVKTTDVKAVLTGQGADEFFNGYVGYLTDFVRRMNRKCFTKEECEINERLWGDPFFRYERNHAEISEINRSLFSSDLRDEYCRFSAINESPVNIERVKGLPSQRRRSYLDAKIRLADHLLGDHGDRMFFSHSIEGRHPFLDINLVKFVMTIPEKYKLNGSNEKYILKKVATGIVPDEIIHRKKKPFSTPGMTFLLKENPKLADMYMNKAIIEKHGVFDYKEVKKMIDQYRQEGFNIEGQYHLDYLQVVITVSMLCEKYGLSV